MTIDTGANNAMNRNDGTKKKTHNLLTRVLLGSLLSLSWISIAIADSMSYGYEVVDGHKIFYREAGDTSDPTIVMLHGFPSSSHQYRNLMRDLSDAYHVIAPDYPGFGASDFPSSDEFAYTFDNLARTINAFLEQRGLEIYSLVLHDYGAPVGFRIARQHPERVSALLVQNGNAYEEGIDPDSSASLKQLWENRTPDVEERFIANAFSAPALQWQYTHGTQSPDALLPDNWLLDIERMQRPGQHDMHLDLFYDYQNNLKSYPEWQNYLRENQPPVLVTWGKNDAFFTTEGAEAYRRDVEDLELVLLDTGHFPLEEKSTVIAETTRRFLKARGIE